jgi:hypothetical protein
MVCLAMGVLLLSGCAGGTQAPDGSAATDTVGPTSTAGALPTKLPTKLPVTVPGLGGEAPAPGVAGSAEAPTPGAEDGAGNGASPAATASADQSPSTVDVQLVGCDDCQVLGTHANVVGEWSAALIGQGGRAAIISVDPAGTLVGIQSVPYGVTFAPQPDGQLACGAGGRCIVRAAQADGRAVLSAFGLGADGKWTDLSGSDGFVSATDKALPVALEDSLGAAVQVTDGTTTVWNVLAWNGSAFATLGCSPGGDSPDLAALDLAACLS